MPTDFPETNIDVKDERQAGLLDSVGSDTRIKLPRFIKDTGVTRWFRFVQPTTVEDLVHEEYDVSTATIEAAIGQLGAAPTGGTFSLTFAGSGTNITGLSGIITAAALETALNSNAGISSAGSVDVEQFGLEYVITFRTVGDKALVTVADYSALSPSSLAESFTSIPGDGSTHEVQILRLVQNPWAYTSTFTPTTVGAVTATNQRVGTSALPHIYRVAITPDPYGGSFNLTLARNTAAGALKQQWLLTILGDTAGSLGSHFFDLPSLTQLVRIWLNNGGSAPNTPTGGRLLPVAYTNGDSASVLGGKIVTAVDADADFTSYLFDSVTPKIHIGLAATGAPVAEPASAQNSTFTLVNYVTGSAGTLPTLSAAVPVDSSAEQLAQLFGNNYTVTKSGSFQWDLTSIVLGAQPSAALDYTGVAWPKWYEATLSLNRLALHEAFGLSTESELDAVFEVRITQSGAEPFVALQIPCKVARNLIELGTLGAFDASTAFVMARVLTGSATWNPGLITAGSSEKKSGISVPGAVVGDRAIAALSTITTSDWGVQACITAADTAEVRIDNRTIGSIDLPSGTVTVTAFH